MSLTIKQAFEALSDACANGMKNPFFVMRRLKESFADVASKVVDASGDKVTVTQTLTEGTQIGSIKVNDVTTALYAPNASSNYSTTEHVVGKWIDGTTDVYEKTINIGEVAAAASKDVAHGIAIDKIVSVNGSAYFTSTSIWAPIPFVDNDVSYQRYCYVTDTNVRIGGAPNASAISEGYVTIRYTKSST